MSSFTETHFHELLNLSWNPHILAALPASWTTIYVPLSGVNNNQLPPSRTKWLLNSITDILLWLLFCFGHHGVILDHKWLLHFHNCCHHCNPCFFLWNSFHAVINVKFFVPFVCRPIYNLKPVENLWLPSIRSWKPPKLISRGISDKKLHLNLRQRPI